MTSSNGRAMSFIGKGVCSNDCEGGWWMVGVLVPHGVHEESKTDSKIKSWVLLIFTIYVAYEVTSTSRVYATTNDISWTPTLEESLAVFEIVSTITYTS